MSRGEDDAAIYHHDRGTQRRDKEKEKTNLEMCSICHSVVLRNFDTVVETLLLIVLLKQMEIRDLIPCPQRPLTNGGWSGFHRHPPWSGWNDLLPSWKSWSQWVLGRHSRREVHTFSFAWLLGNRPALKGVRDATSGERNVRMHTFQSIK